MWYQALSHYQEVIVIYSWENDTEEPVCQRFLPRLHPHKSKLIHGTAFLQTRRQADILVQKHPDVYYVYQQVVVVNKGCLQIQHLLRVNSLKHVNKEGTTNKSVMALVIQLNTLFFSRVDKDAVIHGKSLSTNLLPFESSQKYFLCFRFNMAHKGEPTTSLQNCQQANLKSDLFWFLFFILVVFVPFLYKGLPKLIATLAGEIGQTSEHRLVMQPTYFSTACKNDIKIRLV